MSDKEDWQTAVPEPLHADAAQLLTFLQALPGMQPRKCPWCDSLRFTLARGGDAYQCRSCRRHFTARTGTPFAKSRHPELWAIYARGRLCGIDLCRLGQLTGLSRDACMYRDEAIGLVLRERWPALGLWWQTLLTGGRRSPHRRTVPFTSKEEAWAHHNHEYIQCLECGSLFSFLSTHLRKTHQMSAQEYREKWQIMKQIPLAGFANRRAHSESIKSRMLSGDADMAEQVAIMQAANRKKHGKSRFIRITSATYTDVTLLRGDSGSCRPPLNVSMKRHNGRQSSGCGSAK